jgi:hypothetical protein
MRETIAIILAAGAASLYALSTSLQALEARKTPPATALRASLIARLLRRRVWLLGTAAGAVAWPMQAAALAFGSIALVQPALGLGLVVLLLLGRLVLHEAIGVREITGGAVIVLAVALLGWAAPAETGDVTTLGAWVIGVGAAIVGCLPIALRALGLAGGLATSIGAGLGWAWVGLSTTLVDASIGDRTWAAALGWGVALAAVSFGALVSEMTSLQAWPATRAIPIVFGLEMVLPAALAPFLTRLEPRHLAAFAIALVLATAGAIILGGARTVARAAVADGQAASSSTEVGR